MRVKLCMVMEVEEALGIVTEAADVRSEFCGALVTIHPRPHMQAQVIRAGAAHSRPSTDSVSRQAHSEAKMNES